MMQYNRMVGLAKQNWVNFKKKKTSEGSLILCERYPSILNVSRNSHMILMLLSNQSEWTLMCMHKQRHSHEIAQQYNTTE